MNKKITTIVLVRSALLGAIGSVLMQFSLTLPIFPGFLSLDLGNLPPLIAAITTGPLAGFLSMLIKNLLDPIIFGTNTGGIGNFANFLMGVALVVPIGFVFKKYKNIPGYLVGGAAGVVCTAIVAAFVNYFILIPLFARIFIPMETIISVANAVNDNVDSMFTLIIFAIVPFNLLKGVIVVAVGFLIYLPLRPVMSRLS
jgi:LPXTG-motif cell wall-anchored protein